MDVTFYDASDNSVIGTDTNVGSGGIASVTWTGLDPGTVYSWYAVVDDGELTTRSQTWSFTTSYPPSPDDLTASPVSDDHAFTTEATFSDPDGDDDIVSCEREVQANGNTETYTGSVDRSVGDSDQAACVFDTPVRSSDNSGWSHTGDMTVIVRATDSNGNTGQNTALESFPNHAPEIVSAPSFTNESGQHAFEVQAVAEDTDDGADEIASCTVYHSDGDGNSGQTAGTVDPDAAGQDQAQCTATVAMDDIDGYEIDDRISVYVEFSDRHGGIVQTSSATNTFPNQPPTIHAPSRTFPASPVFDDLVRVQINTSDPEGDTIEEAAFTIWEHNDDIDRRLIHMENGTTSQDGNYLLWNSSAIAADLEAGTYNYSVTVSDGHDTATASDTIFTLKAVSPNVSEATLVRPDPWGLQKSSYRPGQSFQAWVTVQDFNGRTDIEDYTATITGPASTTTIEDLTVQNRVLNGYNLSLFYSIPGEAGTGTWDLAVEATDQDGLVTTNTTTFTVQDYTSFTSKLTYDQGIEDIVIDGTDQGTGLYSSLRFPYVVETNGSLMTGLIDYGRFQQLGYSDSGRTRFNLTQRFEDSTVLIPAAEANTGDLEALEGDFTGDIFSGRGFLDNARASIAYGISEEKTVRVEASYRDNPDIELRGFNGTLGTGYHQLAIQNAGTDDGTTIIEVTR